jgi:hypothetical protein
MFQTNEFAHACATHRPIAKYSKTPQGAIPRPALGNTPTTPIQSTPTISSQTKGLVPFAFVNPYNTDQACKAKVSKKVCVCVRACVRVCACVCIYAFVYVGVFV